MIRCLDIKIYSETDHMKKIYIIKDKISRHPKTAVDRVRSAINKGDFSHRDLDHIYLLQQNIYFAIVKTWVGVTVLLILLRIINVHCI